MHSASSLKKEISFAPPHFVLHIALGKRLFALYLLNLSIRNSKKKENEHNSLKQ